MESQEKLVLEAYLDFDGLPTHVEETFTSLPGTEMALYSCSSFHHPSPIVASKGMLNLKSSNNLGCLHHRIR